MSDTLYSEEEMEQHVLELRGERDMLATRVLELEAILQLWIEAEDGEDLERHKDALRRARQVM